MHVPFAMDGNSQEGKQLVIECKALKWVKTNSDLHKRSLWWVPMVDGIIVTLLSWLWWL